jgi:hypothetical protein
MSDYVKIMEQYKIARRGGREDDAKALLEKARKLAKSKKVTEDEMIAGAYI